MIKERIWVRLIKTSTERVLCSICATYLIFLVDFVYHILLLRFMKFCLKPSRLFLLFLFLFLITIISPSKGCSPLGIRIPGLYSHVRGYHLTQENACCLRLQPHLYPSMVATGLGRGDELRHSRREYFELMSI